MKRQEAADLLGVEVDADSTTVRQAWRVWAKLAHPDIGGDRAHFETLTQARNVLLANRCDSEPVRSTVESSSEPVARVSLRRVVSRPTRRGLLAIVVTVVVMTLVALIALLASGLPDAVTALILGSVASIIAISVQRSCLRPWADTGHRIAFLIAGWLPVAILLTLAAVTAGTSLISVLPVFVLPLVATVAWVNPGAGLWRPVRVMS